MTLPAINPGRNLPVATAVGLALLGLLIGSLLIDHWVFAGLIALAAGFASRELVQMFGQRQIRLTKFLILATPVCVLIAYGYGLISGLISLVVCNAIGWVLELRRGVIGFLAASTGFSFSLFYVGVGLVFAAALSRAELGTSLVLTSVLLTAASDTGGYFAGILFGKHPMFPNISPKKSWEGFAGSVFLQTLIGGLVVPQLLPITPQVGALAGLAMTFSATVGDLIESALKRDFGVKDSSDAIPGHGGVLDRIDGHLLNSVVTWLIFVAVLNV